MNRRTAIKFIGAAAGAFLAPTVAARAAKPEPTETEILDEIRETLNQGITTAVDSMHEHWLYGDPIGICTKVLGCDEQGRQIIEMELLDTSGPSQNWLHTVRVNIVTKPFARQPVRVTIGQEVFVEPDIAYFNVLIP